MMHNQSTPPVRVVIPARNAMTTLPQCLAALRGSLGLSPEIVLVDDGGNAGIDRIVNAYDVTVHKTSGGAGAGAARNLGAAGLDEGILVFIDADVVVDPEAVPLLIQPLLDGAADASVGNYSTSTEGMNFAEAYKELYLAHTYGSNTGNLRNQFWTALGAIRAEVFHEVGGFHRGYRGAGSEDVELGVRLTRADKRVLAVPEATGRHMAKRTVSSTICNDLRKGCGDFYTHMKHRAGLTDNRHATGDAVAAVGLAGLTSLSLVTAALFGSIWLAVGFAMLGVWALLRARMLLALGPLGLRAWAMSFLLDLVRGCAVVVGTGAYVGERCSGGRWNPMSGKCRGVRGKAITSIEGIQIPLVEPIPAVETHSKVRAGHTSSSLAGVVR